MTSLDSDNCLGLSHVLQAFNAALNEEQCWAIAYQTLIVVQSSSLSSLSSNCCLFDPKYLFLKKDGRIHEKSLTEDPENRVRAQNRNQLLASLGVVLFRALDFGLEEDEERSLSRDLELLIESLTSSDPSLDLETKDEGIERDFDHSLEDVIHKCVSRLSSRESADTHYRAVVRALVAETLELSSFLEQVSRGTQELKKIPKKTTKEVKESEQQLEELEFHDWARLWIQVIRQLRAGVKLRKVDPQESREGVPLEYELTPFEMLLDDIRFRRYKLNRVMIDGNLPPRVKKDAHDLILDFIRSRPPLVPVSQRQLKEAPTKETTLYERLMDSIRQKEVELKPILKTHVQREVETSRTKLSSQELTPTPRRRLIKADLNLRLSNSFDDEEEEDLKPKTSREDREEESQESRRKFSLKNLSLKLLERRHSITVCESPEPIDVNEDTRQHVAQIWESTEWGRALQCLSLTLQEVQHIRSVLTKAELETLAVTRELREDLESGRICFTCLKTRFSFFGSRPHVCKVCERAICERCATRMHIPNETFEKVPIYMLSPTPSPPLSPPDWPMSGEEQRQRQMHPKSKSRILQMMSRDAIVVDAGLRKSGPLVRVCRDCKILVRHLIDMGTNQRQY